MIGENLKYIRRKNNITQKHLADSLGVSRQAVCMWEAGKRELKATTLFKVAKVFEVSVDEIMNGQRVVP